jgi:Glyoxalase-like domain
MAARIDLTLDCGDAAKLAQFWKAALGYVDEPPPPPFKTREEWLDSLDLPDDDEGDAAWLCDPAGAGPRLSAAGAAVLAQDGQHHVVMADPEGNEFCVA